MQCRCRHGRAAMHHGAEERGPHSDGNPNAMIRTLGSTVKYNNSPYIHRSYYSWQDGITVGLLSMRDNVIKKWKVQCTYKKENMKNHEIKRGSFRSAAALTSLSSMCSKLPHSRWTSCLSCLAIRLEKKISTLNRALIMPVWSFSLTQER
jgi:hypothetical protein